MGYEEKNDTDSGNFRRRRNSGDEETLEDQLEVAPRYGFDSIYVPEKYGFHILFSHPFSYFYKSLHISPWPPHAALTMTLDPAWIPAEDGVTLFNERTWLAGMILSAVAYGIVFTLFVLTFKQLVRSTTKYNYNHRLCFIIYITLIFILGTLFVGALAKMTQLSFIDYRLFPGGPGSFHQNLA
jgi:uncharacterized membrane protein YidH (DUF202 family)